MCPKCDIKVQKDSKKTLSFPKDNLQRSLWPIRTTLVTPRAFWTRQKRLEVGMGKHTKSCVVPHFPLIWHSRSHLPKILDNLDENCPSNRANQILDPPIINWKFYNVQTYSCGVSIQWQLTGMLALCARMLIWVSVSGDNRPDGLISKCTLRYGRWGLYLQIRSPKLKSEHTAPTFQSIVSG